MQALNIWWIGSVKQEAEVQVFMKAKISLHRKVRLSEFFFFPAQFFSTVNALISVSLYANMLSTWFFQGIKMLILICVFLKFAMAEHFSRRKIILFGIIFVIAAIAALTSDRNGVVISFTVILAAEDIELEKTVKWLMAEIVFLVSFVMLSCRVGILEDYVYNNTASQSGLVHSYGFLYFSTLGYAGMLLMAGYLYLRRKRLKYKEIIGLFILNYLWYHQVHCTELAYYVVILLLAAYICVYQFQWAHLQKKFWFFFATVLPAAMCFFTVLMVLLYRQGCLPAVFLTAFPSIKQRLIYMVYAFNEYGIHLFGTSFRMYGNDVVRYGEVPRNYFYIDSGYFFSLLAYGIVFTGVILILYTLLYRYLYWRNDKFLYIWFGVMVIASTTNNFLLSVTYNPLIYLIPRAIAYYRTSRRVKRQKRSTSEEPELRDSGSINDPCEEDGRYCTELSSGDRPIKET